MAERISIQVNVLAEMRKMRDSAFKEPYAFIDELAQNAQRSGSDNLRFVLNRYGDDPSITIYDDGCGLDDPQLLFSKGDVGWSEDVRLSCQPFGEGFFSVLAAANKVEAWSQDWKATFRFSEMEERGTVEDCVHIRRVKERPGFRVKLSEIYDSRISMYQVMNKIEEACQFIPIKVYCDRKRIPQASFNRCNEDFAVRVEEDGISGFIYPHAYKSIKIYSHYRYVEDMYITGLSGYINVDVGIVDLQSPDRRSIIRNHKYELLQKILRSNDCECYRKVLRSGDSKSINSFSTHIKDRVETEEYSGWLRYLPLGDDADTCIKYLRDCIDAELLDSDATRIISRSPSFIYGLLDLLDDTDEISERYPDQEYVQLHEDAQHGLDKEEVLAAGPGYFVEVGDAVRYPQEFITNLRMVERFQLPFLLVRNDMEATALESMHWEDIDDLEIEMEYEAHPRVLPPDIRTGYFRDIEKLLRKLLEEVIDDKSLTICLGDYEFKELHDPGHIGITVSEPFDEPCLLYETNNEMVLYINLFSPVLETKGSYRDLLLLLMPFVVKEINRVASIYCSGENMATQLSLFNRKILRELTADMSEYYGDGRRIR